MWAEVLHTSVGKLRNRIVTGFLDCMREPKPNSWDDRYDGRLSREELTDQEVLLITGALGPYEDAADRLCQIWIAEMDGQSEDERAQRDWEAHIFEVYGEHEDWWP